VAIIQSHGMQVMGGFILGFDTDREDIFDRMTDFIKKSGIPIAMVGLLQAMPGTQLFRRLRREGRILHTDAGDNTSVSLNFLPRMDASKLVEGYRSVLKQIYSSEAYYKRIKLYLSRIQTASGEKRIKQRWLTRANARALVTSIVRQGVFGRQRWSYWKFLAAAATRYRHSFGTAMTLAVMGYHFQVMTRKLSKFKLPTLPSAANAAQLPAETGEQT
jgi:radical SAM superfamily enzyme YgiQ (UPF0313 family)